MQSIIRIDINSDRIIDAIYAGDLKGNFWKFDVSSSDPNQWAVAYNQTPLFSAPGQAITVKPIFRRHPNGGILLYFGTGSYFQTGDNVVGATPQTQSFYALWDSCIKASGTTSPCSNTPINKTDLVQQIIEAEISTGTTEARQTSNNPVPSDKKGWYIDLLSPPSNSMGERVIGEAQLTRGNIVFITITPNNTNSCSAGVTSWFMELDSLTGSRLLQTPFDLNGNGFIGKEDQIGSVGNPIAASGARFKMGMIKKPAIVNGIGGTNSVDYKFLGLDSNGKPLSRREQGGSPGQRESWVQLR